MSDVMERIDAAKLTHADLETEVMKRLTMGESFDKIEAFILEEEPDAPAIVDWPDHVEVPGRIEQANSRAARRDYKEALYDLSVALGRDFDWLNDIKPEHLS